MAFGDFTVTRASTKNVLGSAGLYVSVANDTPAFEFNTDGSYRGLLVEPGATNLALNNRNLTTASWTATNVTTAQTATGADGGANSATTLTASDANGTVLQAITSASASRIFSAVVRRRTGTGTIEITQDNGSTWTEITLTSSFQRFSTAAQTLTNPTVGFRIVTSGDEIDVDYTQAETGSVATSPIVTTAGTANRVADVVSLTGASSLIGQASGSLYIEINYRIYSRATASRIIDLDPLLVGIRRNVDNQLEYGWTGVGNFINVDVLPTSGVYKILFRYDGLNQALFVNGVKEDERVASTAFSTPISSIYLGNRSAGDRSLGDNSRTVALFPTAISDAQAIALTTL
jgi:hypothetical protein